MKPTWLVLPIMLLAAGTANADSSNLEGGVFIAHHPPGLQYSAGQDYCQRYFQDFAIDSCSEQNNRIDLDGNQGQTSVWYVLAAWGEEKEWCGAEFGFADYDSNIYAFGYWGPCFPGGPNDGLQLATAGWPGPNAGVSLSISGTAWSGNFTPVYWFMGYSYYEGEIPLAANPSTEFGGTANCDSPPQSWSATAFGSMGIFQDGTSVCPEELSIGGGELDGGTQPDGADGYGGYEPDYGGQDYRESQWIPLEEGQSFDIHLGQSNGDEIVIEMTLNGFFATPDTIDGEAYNHLSLAGEPLRSDVGAPELLYFARSVIIPDDQHMTISVIDSQYVDIPDMPIAPSKGDLRIGVDPDTIPYEFGPAYDSDSLYPARSLAMGRPYILRDFRGLTVSFNAFQARPASDTLRVFTKLTVAVTPTGTDTVNIIERSTLPDTLDFDFSQLYEHHFMNYAQVDWAEQGPPSMASEPLLIIAADAFLGDDLDDLAQWKNQAGRPTQLVALSEIPVENPSRVDDIRDFIKDAYWGPPHISHVLLVGDSPQIPSYVEPDYGGWGEGLADPWYTLLQGDDIYPDVFIGRFSANNGTQVHTQVNRTIWYERDLGVGHGELGHGFGLATNQGIAPPGPPPTNLEWMSLRLNELTQEVGFTDASHIYEWFENGQWVSDGDAADFADYLCNPQKGLGLILASCHGEPRGWGNHFPYPDFKVPDVNDLSNWWRLPLIHAQSCDLGKFDYEQTCFAEAWMWHEDEETGDPGGAIGTYMGSRPLSAYGPQYAQEGTVALLASPSKVSVGLALYGGVEDFIAHYETSDPAKARGNFIVWTVFGDPSLSLRTAAPTLMDVTHDGYLLPGQTEYAISVRSVAGGEPITGALGALFADGVLYGTGWTDAGGDATIVLDPVPETPMWLTLTVTARDRVTYWETNNVHPSCLVRPDGSGDYETIQDALDDAVSGWVIQLSDGEFVGGGNRELDCRGKCLTIMSQSGDPAACVIDCESSGIDAHCGIVFDRWALGGELVLKGLTITNGRRESGGGAVCCLGESGTCDLNATQCMFTGNQSDGRGGAVLCEGDANLAWCTFAWNTAEYGGGVACEGELGITKSTFFGNEAGEAGGGGIYFPSGATGTVTNTIIAFSGSGGGVVCEDEIGPSMACCDMFGNVGGDWNRCTEDLGGNFSLDPCFCDAENGDFALWNYSPCLQEGCGLVGAWDFGCSDPSRTSEGTVGAVTYGLGPIWPVPASDGFRLKYSVGADCEKLPVNVGIYDVTGRCVRTLANGTRRPGTYTLDWDGNDEAGNAVAAGVFFCRMAHGSRTMSRPVVVLKNR